MLSEAQIPIYHALYAEHGRCIDCGNIEPDGKCVHYHNAAPINPTTYTCKHWIPKV